MPEPPVVTLLGSAIILVLQYLPSPPPTKKASIYTLTEVVNVPLIKNLIRQLLSPSSITS